MLISFFRTCILLIVIVIAIRIMGKRQIGQLQPAELVVTILLSEIAATPMQDNDIPMTNTIIAILVLVALEILMSAISMKSVRMRSLLQGNSLVLIREGKIDQKQMKRLRYTLDDLIEALRQKDVFDINDVQYAIAETDGSISVLLKPEKRPVSVEDMGVEKSNKNLFCVTVMDGTVIRSDYADCNMDDKKLKKIIDRAGVDIEDIYLLMVDKNGNVNLIEKENNLD